MLVKHNTNGGSAMKKKYSESEEHKLTSSRRKMLKKAWIVPTLMSFKISELHADSSKAAPRAFMGTQGNCG